MVYKAKYSPDGSLEGYTNFTLSYFSPSDFDPPGSYGHNGTATTAAAVNLDHPEFCRYHGFRYPPWHPELAYHWTEVFWHILAARLSFVVVFQGCDSIRSGVTTGTCIGFRKR